jgi:hypothetical protein
MPLYGQSSASPRRFMQTGSWPLFRLPSVDRPSIFCGYGGCLLPRLRACRKGTPGAYEEGIAGMLTIIKASLLGSALMLLESCTGYLTSYQTPFGHCNG